jgi:tripartite-type tricarboxylate transporter receptor subunit TctC
LPQRLFKHGERQQSLSHACKNSPIKFSLPALFFEANVAGNTKNSKNGGHMTLSTRNLIAGFALLAAATTPVFAQDYPSKTIEIIVPSSAGGSTDTTARIFAEVAEAKYEGFKFVVNNIDGSGGQKGFEAIARADADGYTMGLVFTPQLVAHVAAGRAQYTLDSFHILGNTADDPEIVVVPKDSPIKTMADLAEAAKSGELTVAINGIGSDDFLAAKAFEALAGVTFNLLPTKGSTEQKAAILGGHVEASFMNLSQMESQHKAGDATIIAMLTDVRNDLVPDVPTAIEAGYALEMRATRGFVIPAGVPAEIRTQLDKMFTAVMADPTFQEKAAASSIYLLNMNGPDYTAYLQNLQVETQKVFDAAPW